MATIKTGISIDEGIYNEVERMTKWLHISRSQFFSQAAKYMIERKENVELLQKINNAYEAIKESNKEKSQRVQEKKYHKKGIPERWK